MPLLWPARRMAPSTRTTMTTPAIRVSTTDDSNHSLHQFVASMMWFSVPLTALEEPFSKYKGDLQMTMSLRFTVSGVLALIMGATCFGQHYTQTNLVSNEAGVAPVTDPQLINPWGISRASGSPWWVSDNATGFSTLYNGAGAKQSLIVTIPPADPTNKNTRTGTPTGTIFNGSQTDFFLAPGKPARFLFSTNDGTIAGWNPAVAATLAMTGVKTTDGYGSNY